MGLTGEDPAELAAEAGHLAARIDASIDHLWLQAMFNHYDHFGLPVGTRPLSMLLRRQQQLAKARALTCRRLRAAVTRSRPK